MPRFPLDAQTRPAMQRLLVDVWRAHPRKVVFVTHDVDEALALGDGAVPTGPTGVAELIDVPHPRSGHPDPTTRDRVLATLHDTKTPAQTP